MEWMRRAACADTDPELFFPVSNEGPGATQRAEAKRVCAGCPVRAECLEYALESKQRSGVWGGLDERERATLHRGRRSRSHSSGAGRH